MKVAKPCGRCVLRAQNNREADAYDQASGASSSIPCPICLGILQDGSLDAVSTAITALLPMLTHSKRFKINASLPPTASILRDRAFHRAIQARHYPTLPSATPLIPLREAVKLALCPRLFRSASITYHPDADLFLLVNYTHPETQPELKLITNLSYPPSNKRPRNADSTGQISRLVDAMSDVDFEAAVSNTLIPPPLVSQHVSFTTSVTTAPLLLAGTYTKRSRILSQTPWFVDGPADAPDAAKDEHGRVKRTTQSVEEVVTAGILGLLRPEKATFTAGGREDVDVRMLGSGRPFVVEVLNSKIAPSQVTDTMVTKMAAISNAVSHAVGVHDLRVVPKEYFARMRAFEAEKRKHYRCVVWTSKQYDLETFKCKLEVQGGFLLKQKTPLRVLHRRTQTAGTYIKEFVHGDNGRTIPNVAGLLSCDADIVQLDVTEISGS